MPTRTSTLVPNTSRQRADYVACAISLLCYSRNLVRTDLGEPERAVCAKCNVSGTARGCGYGELGQLPAGGNAPDLVSIIGLGEPERPIWPCRNVYGATCE